MPAMALPSRRLLSPFAGGLLVPASCPGSSSRRPAPGLPPGAGWSTMRSRRSLRQDRQVWDAAYIASMSFRALGNAGSFGVSPPESNSASDRAAAPHLRTIGARTPMRGSQAARFTLLALGLGAALLSTTCGGDSSAAPVTPAPAPAPPPPPPPPNATPTTRLEIPDLTVTLGEPKVLSLALYFADPDGASLTYMATSSDDLTLTATVSGARLTLTALRDGLVKVMVTASDPGGLTVTQTFVATVGEGSVAPRALGRVPDQALQVADGPTTLNVSSQFTRPVAGNGFVYEARSSDAMVVAVSIENRSVARIVLTPIGVGTATVTVSATDTIDRSAEQSFSVTVTEAANRGPITVGTLSERTLAVGQDPLAVDVAASFSDPDGDPLTYRAESSRTEIVGVRVSGGQVVLTPVAAGMATVTITATDPGGLSAEQELRVRVGGSTNPGPQREGTISDQTLQVRASIIIDLAQYFSDPGDSLTYRATSTNSEVAVAQVLSNTDDQLLLAAVAVGRARVSVSATDSNMSVAIQEFAVTVTAQVEDQRPRAVGSIPVPSLMVDGQPATVTDLSQYFSDPGGGPLTFTATSDSDHIARVDIVDNTNLLVTPVAAGRAVIRVVARNTAGLTAEQVLAVTVAEPANLAPQVDKPLEPLFLRTAASTIGLSRHFSDPEKGRLRYKADSARPHVVAASVTGTELTLIPLESGKSRITVTATDPEGLEATEEFEATVQTPSGGYTFVEDDAIPSFPMGDGALAFNRSRGRGGVFLQDGIATVQIRNFGYIQYESFTYYCEADLCEIRGGSVTQGEITRERTREYRGEEGAPTVSGTQVMDQSIDFGSDASVNVADWFEDPEGDRLQYTAFSSHRDIVGVVGPGKHVGIDPNRIWKRDDHRYSFRPERSKRQRKFSGARRART